MSTGVGNIFRWYWDANIKDIWEEALGNDVKASAELSAIKYDVARSAYDLVCEKWPKGSPEKKEMIYEVFSGFNGTLADWVGSRANRSIFCALAFGASTPRNGTENPNTQYLLQALVNDTIYVTNGESKVEAHFFGDSKIVIITYIPYLKYGYYRILENTHGTTEDELDEFFDNEIEAKLIKKAYHVERDEFQVSFEQINNALQQNQG